MARVDFGNGAIVDIDDSTMADPKALANIANAVKFQHGADETTGADASLRFAVGSAAKPEDQLATLKAKGLDAGFVGNDLYYRDEQGKSRRVNPKGFDLGDVAGAAPEVAEAAGSTIGAIVGGAAGLPTGPGAIATGMAGSAAGAVAGKEGAQWLGRQFFGTQDTRSGLERLADVGTTAALGAAGEGAGQLLGQGVKLARTAFVPSAENRATTALFAQIGAPATAGQATESRVLRSLEDLAGGSRLGQKPLTEAVERQNQALGGAVDRLTTDRHGWPLAQQAGARVQLQQLGGGADGFDATTFLKNWKALDPRDKHKLNYVDGLGESLSNLTDAMAKTAALSQRAGKAATSPLGSMANILGMAGAGIAGGVPGAIGAAVAPAVAARLLTSKRFVNWLSKVPTSPGALSRHLGRLSVMAEGDDDVRAFGEALGR